MLRKSLPARGFTLIEITASLFVLGVLIIASTSLLRGVQVNRLTQSEDLALKIANNEIETVRAGGYAALPASGPFTDSELSSLASSTATITVSTYNSKTKKVDVSVSWVGPDRDTHTTTLTTLVTEIGGLK